MDELELIEPLKMPEPCTSAKAQLQNHGSGRYMHLSKLKASKGFCVWCEGPLKGRQQRWCSDDCVAAAHFYCQPQRPANKMYRLIYLQQCACAGCGQSFEDQIKALIIESWKRWNGMWGQFSRPKANPEKVPLHYVGDNTGDRWQTDHIVPIYKGGKGIDPANLQVLCVGCHQVKTVEERR